MRRRALAARPSRFDGGRSFPAETHRLRAWRGSSRSTSGRAGRRSRSSRWTGRVADAAFEPVEMLLGRAAPPSSDPQDWWGRSSPRRRALDRCGERRGGRGRPASGRARSRWTPAASPLRRDHLARQPRRRAAPGARGGRAARASRATRREARALDPADRRRAVAVGPRPARPHPLAARPAARRLRGGGDVPRARRLAQHAPRPACAPRRTTPRRCTGSPTRATR